MLMLLTCTLHHVLPFGPSLFVQRRHLYFYVIPCFYSMHCPFSTIHKLGFAATFWASKRLALPTKTGPLYCLDKQHHVAVQHICVSIGRIMYTRLQVHAMV